jgi:hypothetical protein
MQRFVLAAIVAVALTLAGGQSARANGFSTVPGYISLSGGVSLSWGSFGWNCNPSGCGGSSYYANPTPYNAYPYGMNYGNGGYGYGGYGYGYPGCYGY